MFVHNLQLTLFFISGHIQIQQSLSHTVVETIRLNINPSLSLALTNYRATRELLLLQRDRLRWEDRKDRRHSSSRLLVKDTRGDHHRIPRKEMDPCQEVPRPRDRRI